MSTDKIIEDIDRLFLKEKKIALKKIEKLERKEILNYTDIEHELKTLDKKFKLLKKRKTYLDEKKNVYTKKIDDLNKKKTVKEKKIVKLKVILKQVIEYETEIKGFSDLEKKLLVEKKHISSLLKQLSSLVVLKKKKEKLLNSTIKRLKKEEKHIRKI